MILRPLLLLSTVLSLAFAGIWPAFIERAALSIRQVIGQDTETTTAAAGGNAAQQTAATVATTPANAATQQAANPQTQAGAAAGANTDTDTETTPTAATTPLAANPVTTATTPTAATARTTARTTATTPAAAAPVAPVAPAAPAAPAADPADFEIPFDQQTGTMRYAPMPRRPGTSIDTKQKYTPQYPTSAWSTFLEAAGAGTVVATVTQPATYASIVSSEAVMIAAASPPSDTAMQKFLNRWKD